MMNLFRVKSHCLFFTKNFILDVWHGHKCDNERSQLCFHCAITKRIAPGIWNFLYLRFLIFFQCTFNLKFFFIVNIIVYSASINTYEHYVQAHTHIRMNTYTFASSYIHIRRAKAFNNLKSRWASTLIHSKKSYFLFLLESKMLNPLWCSFIKI